MKPSPKSTSSPARTDDFPPPLMRFPRTKSSRGSRSRTNPMFVTKINTANQEPSSPKVTCIGQVRVNNHQTTTAFRCRCLPKLKRAWRTSVSFIRCPKSKTLPESEEEVEANNQRRECQKREIGTDNEILAVESPPRNAFLLTRSRSVPDRSSFLASKSWETTMEKTGEEREEDEKETEVADKVGTREETEAINASIGKEKGGDEGSINGVEELKAEPLKLSRCKTVPARTGDKLFMFITGFF